MSAGTDRRGESNNQSQLRGRGGCVAKRSIARRLRNSFARISLGVCAYAVRQELPPNAFVPRCAQSIGGGWTPVAVGMSNPERAACGIQSPTKLDWLEVVLPNVLMAKRGEAPSRLSPPLRMHAHTRGRRASMQRYPLQHMISKQSGPNGSGTPPESGARGNQSLTCAFHASELLLTVGVWNPQIHCGRGDATGIRIRAIPPNEVPGQALGQPRQLSCPCDTSCHSF